MNWDEAQAYVDWLNTQTRGGYRLLTEVEWEYVARGGEANAAYPWGDDPAKGCPFATVSIRPRWRRTKAWTRRNTKVTTR